MIKCDKGHIEIYGTGAVLLADLTIILSRARKVVADEGGEKIADAVIDNCVAMSRLSDEELDSEEISKKMAFDLFSKLL